MSVLNLPTDRPAVSFIICAAYLLEDMERLAGGRVASPMVNGHCVNGFDPSAAFSWHVDDHAMAEGGEYIARTLICLCDEGESSIVFAGAGEVMYPGVGGCVDFPAWVIHRSGIIAPTGMSMWKLARFSEELLPGSATTSAPASAPRSAPMSASASAPRRAPGSVSRSA